jgi:hypothetical protein
MVISWPTSIRSLRAFPPSPRELVIGDSVIIVADEMPGQPGMLGPRLGTQVEDVPPEEIRRRAASGRY